MIPGPRSRAAVPFLIAFALVASCTSHPGSLPATPSPVVPGQLLSVASGPEGMSLIAYELQDGAASTLGAPIRTETAARLQVTGVGTADGWLFMSPSGRSTQTYELHHGGSTVSKLGPPLETRGDRVELSISAGAAVVADCHEVWVLTLPAAGHWSPAGSGCWGALSPDGRSVASSPDGHTIVTASPTGGRAHAVFDAHDLAGTLHAPQLPRIVGSPVWGDPGLAFLVRAGDQLAVFVREPDGSTVRAYQEEIAPTAPMPHLAWQPSGGLLAIADDAAPSGAVLRLFDPVSRTLTALTFAPGGFAATTWAPDGSSIAVLTQPGQLVIMALDGGWLLRRDVDWNNVLGWSGSA
jgi:hypothetical protein